MTSGTSADTNATPKRALAVSSPNHSEAGRFPTRLFNERSSLLFHARAAIDAKCAQRDRTSFALSDGSLEAEIIGNTSADGKHVLVAQ
jgi:hypothetical protein